MGFRTGSYICKCRQGYYYPNNISNLARIMSNNDNEVLEEQEPQTELVRGMGQELFGTAASSRISSSNSNSRSNNQLVNYFNGMVV